MGSLTNNRAALLEFHNEFIEIARLPEQQRQARWQEFHKNTLTLPLLARLMVPAADKMVEADKRSRAVLRTMIAGLAAERYRLANGDFPASLQVLTPRFLTEVPSDPYDGAALRFRRLPDGIVIYSVGADDKDNGGLLGNGATPGTDIGVRLWEPKHRRRPPATGNEAKAGG
jgi:type II secretory pathway pseudopilin PulG